MPGSFFITPDWLIEHIEDTDIQIVDARMFPPGEEHRDVVAEYQAAHLPGAVFFNIETLSDPTSLLPHMMPRPEAFAVAMRELGIHQNKHLIIYDEGNLFSAPRAWWMLRTLGAENVSILAGGLARWQRKGFPVQQGEVVLPEGEFDVKLDSLAVKRLPEVLLASHEGNVQIIDARPAPRFKAEVDEPRPGLKRGHIPGAVNVPWGDVVENGELKSSEQLYDIFARAGINLQQPIITSCGSGVTAVVVVLALTTLGAHAVSLYDGSWSEWGARSDLPIDAGIK